MSNPFEYFNASDDDEPKTTQVKKEEKHKLSTSSINQLTPKKEPTRSSRKRMPRGLLKLLSKPKGAQLNKLFLKELRITIVEDMTCLVINNAS